MNLPTGQAGAELLLEHFRRLGDAPDAVPRLRRFILDLAVRGKLVEQDGKDEPASVLLKKLVAERKKKVEAKLFKKTKDLPGVELDEQSFAIPSSWSWTRLGVVGDWGSGSTPSRSNHDYYGGSQTWLKSGELNDVIGLRGSEEHVTDRALKECSFRLNQPEDVLIAMYGATIGKLAILAEVAVTNQAVCGCTTLSGVSNRYLFNFLMAQRSAFHAQSEGGAQPNISKEKIINTPFPLPPLTEQHRIVAKVDELMALCDTLEAVQQQREQQRTQLTAATWQAVTEEGTPGRGPGQATDAARFALEQLPALTTRPEQVKALRQTILDLAVRGKLVVQDPKDEPASVLLKKIAAEKARLVKEGKIMREKAVEPAAVTDLDFALQPGWQPAKIIHIIVETQTGPFGSSLHQSDYKEGGIPVINPASMKNGVIVPVDGMAIGKDTLERLPTFKLREGDIVMARRGEMGRCAIVTKKEVGWLCGTGSMILRLPKFVDAPYFVMLIGSPMVRKYLGGSAVGATMQNLNQSILLNLIVGLPPLAEQGRIVAKVAALMALCDGLEAALREGAEVKGKALDAVLQHQLADAAISQLADGKRAYPEVDVELGMAAEPVAKLKRTKH